MNHEELKLINTSTLFKTEEEMWEYNIIPEIDSNENFVTFLIWFEKNFDSLLKKYTKKRLKLTLSNATRVQNFPEEKNYKLLFNKVFDDIQVIDFKEEKMI